MNSRLGWAGADAKQCGIWSNLLSKPISAASLATLTPPPGLTFVAHRRHFFLPKTGIVSCPGGGWRVHLEASSQYQFVSEGGGAEEHPPVQMAGDIILLIVPASEITDRHPPLYCRSFKRDISDIL